MALQFQQPPDWLVKSYLDRPDPFQQINDSVGGALQTYATYATQKNQLDQQKKKQASDQVLSLLSTDPKLLETPYGKQLLAASGVDLTGYTTPGISTGTTPAAGDQAQIPVDSQGNAIAGPMQGPLLPGVGMGMAAQKTPVSGMGAPSPIIDHWKQTVAPTLGSQSPTNNSMPDISSLQGRGKLGKQALDEYGKNLGFQNTQLDIQRKQRELEAGPKANTPKTLEQILAENVANGTMTLDQAIAKKAEAEGLKTGAVTATKNDIELKKEKPKAQASLTNTLREYDNMIKEAEAIKNDPSLGMATGLTGVSSSIPGTGSKRVAARLETLKAKTLLNVLASLKELSTTGASGFGQLSNTEGDYLKNSIATLDRGLSTKDFQASIDRFITEMNNRKGVLSDTFNKTYGDRSYSPVATPQPAASGGGWSYVGVKQ